MMAAIFGDPEVARIVRKFFVPVRLRLHAPLFDPMSRAEDPLKKLGTSALQSPGPALVFADGDGKLLHACSRMGVFSTLFLSKISA